MQHNFSLFSVVRGERVNAYTYFVHISLVLVEILLGVLHVQIWICNHCSCLIVAEWMCSWENMMNGGLVSIRKVLLRLLLVLRFGFLQDDYRVINVLLKKLRLYLLDNMNTIVCKKQTRGRRLVWYGLWRLYFTFPRYAFELEVAYKYVYIKLLYPSFELEVGVVGIYNGCRVYWVGGHMLLSYGWSLHLWLLSYSQN
jgi:hypothetical protein